MLARLRRYLVARRRGRPCRVLYVFGNPLGNALGDTIIASRSVPYLRHIAPRVHVSVWTGDERIWKLWRPGVDTRATLAIEDLDEVDFAVFENTHVPGVFKQRLRAGGAALLTWRPSDRHAVFVLDRGVDESVPLPVCSNVPSRSAEVYRALGWPDSAGANRRGRGARRAAQILVNPYSSVGAKSLTPQFLGLLLDAWRHAVPAGVELIVPARPGRAGGRDEQIYQEIALRAESAVGGPIVVRTLPLRAYLNAIARAALVIGPDTSSQHIAADCRTPSVSCYAPDAAGATYLTWGPPRADSLHFIYPRDLDRDAQERLAALVVELGLRLMGRHECTRVRVAAGPLRRSAKRFEASVRQWMDGNVGARAEAPHLLAELRARVPASWASLLFDDLAILCRELEGLGGRPDADSRYLVTTRMPQITGLKAVEVLAAPRRQRPGHRQRRRAQARSR
jgi:hypothetical protein